MKKYILTFVAFAAALCACNKLENIIPEPQAPEDVIQATELVFTATMEGAPETRATYDGTYKCASWEVDDRISINGFDYKANNAGTSTTFSKVASAAPPMEMRPVFVKSTNTGSYQNQPAQNLVDDGGVDTRWIANKTDMVNGAWNIVVSTGQPVYLKSIKLWNYDNASYPNRRWKTMRLYGSTTTQDDEWEEISDPAPLTSSHPFANLNLAENNRGLAGEIAVNSTKAYTFYRIDVLDNEGDNYMQMADMKFVVNPAANAPYDAYFPASLYDGTTAVLPTNITETWADGKFNMPMYAHSENTELQFKNLCGVLKITVKSDQIAAVKKIRVSSANKATSGEFTVNSDNAAVLVNPNAVDNTVTTVYNTAVPTTAEGTTFYVAVPAQTYQELKIDLSSDAAFTKSMTTKSATDITVVRNTIYPIIFVNNSTPLPDGALPGEFSVAKGKQVLFSKGNLWYGKVGDAQTATFNFEANQYDFASSWSADHVSHFYWSKKDSVAYAQVYSDSDQKPSDVFFTNNPDDATKSNPNFTINVGGDEQSGWRTLTNGEWVYLFNTRSVNGGTGKDKSYSLNITYGGKKGLVLYHDNYTGSALSGTVETLPDGVVFLPAAGGQGLQPLPANNGIYWSSSAYGSDEAYRVDINNAGVWTGFRDPRNCCYSVRLVTDAN